MNNKELFEDVKTVTALVEKWQNQGIEIGEIALNCHENAAKLMTENHEKEAREQMDSAVRFGFMLAFINAFQGKMKEFGVQKRKMGGFKSG